MKIKKRHRGRKGSNVTVWGGRRTDCSGSRESRSREFPEVGG